MKTVHFYKEEWFKVEYNYDNKNQLLHFKAWKIEILSDDDDDSVLNDEDPEIVGNVNWEGCMDLKHVGHYCGVYMAEQTYKLIERIYKFKETLEA